MTELSDKVFDVFPASLIIVTLSSGIVILLLSPLRFFLPPSISNPFQNQTPTDTLGSFGIITICSFVVGIPFFLAEKCIIGNTGLNHRFMQVFRKEKLPEPKAPPAGFYRWLKEKNYGEYFHNLVVKNSIVSGLIIGFEFAFISNVLALLALFLVKSPLFENGMVLTGISLLAVNMLILYNRYHWKPEVDRTVKELREEFEKEKNGMPPEA